MKSIVILPDIPSKGYRVNVKRIRSLYKVMRLNTLYPKLKMTARNESDEYYPYLLKGLEVNRSNLVWQTGITYVPMRKGFMYMAAIMDVYSRKILNWSVSNTMDTNWCCELLEDTIGVFGTPRIHNSDQGSQYTSKSIHSIVEKTSD